MKWINEKIGLLQQMIINNYKNRLQNYVTQEIISKQFKIKTIILKN